MMQSDRKCHDWKTVAFCGTRGIPARYGGFETAVDEISSRFTKNGIRCEVFCRLSSSGEKPSIDHGRYLMYVKGSKKRTLDTFVSSIQTAVYLIKNRTQYEHVFWFNNANFPGILLTRLFGIKMSVNTDGLEWRRAKWSWPFKLYYILTSYFVGKICKSLISDSHAIQNYYQRHFGVKTEFIPYGFPKAPQISEMQSHKVLDIYVVKSKYFLQITRFEPDNLPFETARAFQQSGLSHKGYKMVVIGFLGRTPYADLVKSIDGNDGVIVLDAVYDPERLRILRQNCFCYVHGNSVGGTNPALLEAMASCPRIMAIESPFSREVLGDSALFFDPKNITPTFLEVVQTQEAKDKLYLQVSSRYQWDAVAESYCRLVMGLSADYQPIENETSGIINNPEIREEVVRC
jgi:hypothetical protein